jgi:hypothetical protein
MPPLKFITSEAPRLGRASVWLHLHVAHAHTVAVPLLPAALTAAKSSLTTLEGLGGLTALTKLDVSVCLLQPGALAELRGCSGLAELNLHANSGLSLVGLPAQLASLDASYCDLTSLEPLAGCARLTSLDISYNELLMTLGALRGCGALEVRWCCFWSRVKGPSGGAARARGVLPRLASWRAVRRRGPCDVWGLSLARNLNRAL